MYSLLQNLLSTACCWTVAFNVADAMFQETHLEHSGCYRGGLQGGLYLQGHGLLLVLFLY